MNDDKLILYYYNDGLSVRERQEIEAALAEDAQLAARYAELCRDLDGLKEEPVNVPSHVVQRMHDSIDRVARPVLVSQEPRRSFNPFSFVWGAAVTAALAIGIGIGIPYMIHVTHRYLEERGTQDNENDAIQETLTHTGGALGGSALTTMAGFGVLMLSTTIPFRQFGFVLAYTIFLALLAAVALLPSMLVLWDRWHRNRGDAVLDTAAVEAALHE